ncbi:MAG: S46 family peptidase [Blastocatellia bacterium]|nr:S46 family peptidase [Blastocatellia bacterium]
MYKAKFFQRIFALILLFTFFTSSLMVARADEGMWIFGNPPLKQLKEKYNFSPDQQWLDHARLSAVRFNNGSGAFVSANGLAITNHHIVRSTLAKLSTAERNILKTGFYAPTFADELKCPDLELNVLVGMENVTEKIGQVAKQASDAKGAEELRKAEIAKIEKESLEKTKLKSTVISLYEGGEYWLYQYKKYTDVRMVFAPEAQAAEFGGDFDNFTYPRYALDFSFVRVYENDKPAKIDHYYRWSTTGPKDNELIFVIGNPGSTDRLRTIAQIKYQRDVSNPFALKSLTRQRDKLVEYSALGQEQERRASDTISGLNNTLKRLNGQQEGLLTNKLMQQKIQEEQDLREKVAANPELKQLYGSAWDEMAAAYEKLSPMSKRIFYSSLSNSQLARLALTISQYVTEVKKPNGQRLPAFRDSNLESLKYQLLSPAPIYPDLEEVLLADRLQEIFEELGQDDPFVKATLNGRSPKDVAQQLISQTKLSDVNFRKSLLEGDLANLEKSGDPLLALALRIDPIIRELDKFARENFDGARVAAGEKVAKARFAVYGRSIAPDANFTLRFSYGVVKGHEVGTTLVPYKTTYGGLYDRAASFDNKAPFDLAPKLQANKSAVDLSVPMNFVYTADTIGGNSGSPVINQQGEIFGVNFDSNVHRFVSRYIYTEDRGRAMAVHSAGMLEALRKVYNAQALADELEGRK